MLKEFHNRVTTTFAPGPTPLSGETREVDAPQTAIAEVIRFGRPGQAAPRPDGNVPVRCTATTTIVEERPLWTEVNGQMTRVPEPPVDPQTALARQNYEMTRKWATSESTAYTVWFPHVNPDGEVVRGGLSGLSFGSEAEAIAYAEAAVQRGTHVIGSAHATNRFGRRTGPDVPMTVPVKEGMMLQTTRELTLAEARVPQRVRMLGVRTPFKRGGGVTIS